MGIYDREYYRGQGPSFLGALAGRGQVCKWLIIVNVGAFLVQIFTQTNLAVEQGGFLLNARGLGPFSEIFLLDFNAVLHGQVWRLLTYAFLHDPDNIWHILFNMLFLWWFGPDLEELYGPREFLTFYLAAAFVGGVGFVVSHWAGLPGTQCLGASGAVMGVMVLSALHFPNRVILLFFILPVPVWFIVVFPLIFDAYNFLRGLNGISSGSTATSVHLAGAALGYLYYRRNWRLLEFWSQLTAWTKRRSRPRLRVYREEHEPPRAPGLSSSHPDVDEQMEAKVDAVLEKVARSGKDSLTENERQLLLRASEVYKRRRT